jgi:Ca2+-binding RTX toxin-like protein
MTGGAGADTFIFTEYGAGETDIITDFQNGSDVLRFSGIEKAPNLGLQGFVDALNVTSVSVGVSLSYGGNTIVLEGIGTEDFIFI